MFPNNTWSSDMECAPLYSVPPAIPVALGSGFPTTSATTAVSVSDGGTPAPQSQLGNKRRAPWEINIYDDLRGDEVMSDLHGGAAELGMWPDQKHRRVGEAAAAASSHDAVTAQPRTMMQGQVKMQTASPFEALLKFKSSDSCVSHQPGSASRCSSCGEVASAAPRDACSFCGRVTCTQCVRYCAGCGQGFCAASCSTPVYLSRGTVACCLDCARSASSSSSSTACYNIR